MNWYYVRFAGPESAMGFYVQADDIGRAIGEALERREEEVVSLEAEEVDGPPTELVIAAIEERKEERHVVG